MLGRSASLTLLLGLLATLVLAGKSEAHRLEADYRVLPGGKVQVESWFDLTGESPKGARVRVMHADGRLLTEGRLDENGIFIFSFTHPESLKVMVSITEHRKELMIPASELSRGLETQSSAASDVGDFSSAPVPLADRSPRVQLKDVLAGIGFLLAAAAFILSLRNARKVRELSERAKEK